MPQISHPVSSEAFLSRKFGGFVAPLWPVYDQDGREVMELFFELAWKEKRPLGEAMREIRRKYGDRSHAAMGFLYYGHVLARFS